MSYVYLDILFAVNFFIDGSLLIFTAVYCHSTMRFWRIGLAALCGALYGCAWIFYMDSFWHSILYSLFGKLFVSFALIRIAFPWENVKNYMKRVVAFYVINFIAAGAIFAVQMLILSNKQLFDQWIRLGTHNLWALETTASAIVFGLPLTFLAAKSVYSHAKRLTWKKTWVYSCTIVFDHQETRFHGLLDTGNQLTEPLSGKPVSIVEYQVVRNVLPSFVNTVYAARSINMAAIHHFLTENAISDKFTLIPYRVVGSDGDYLLAFKPDLFIIRTEGGDIRNTDCIIAITPQQLSGSNDFTGIIHPNLLDGDIHPREEVPYEDCITESAIVNET